MSAGPCNRFIIAVLTMFTMAMAAVDNCAVPAKTLPACQPPFLTCTAYSCGANKHLIEDAGTVPRGNNPANTCCADDITGQCTGNTDSSKDVACAAGQRVKVAAGTDAAACCEDIVGRCEGNKDTTKDVTCTGTKVNLGKNRAGTDEATCCKEPCSAHSCVHSDGWASDANKQMFPQPDGTNDQKSTTCCKPIMCCGNDPSDMDMNTDKCGLAKHFSGHRLTQAGTSLTAKGRCCSDDITGRCDGNTDASKNVHCPSGKRNKGELTWGKDVAACCEDSCAGYTCPAGKHLVPNAGDTAKGATPNDLCCNADITGKCTGNTDASTDVACPAGQLNKGVVAGTTVAACCQDATMRCSGNKDSSQDVDCASQCRTFDAMTERGCKVNPDAGVTVVYTEANKCAKCCSPPDPLVADADSARREAVLSAVVLAVSLGVIRMF